MTSMSFALLPGHLTLPPLLLLQALPLPLPGEVPSLALPVPAAQDNPGTQ